MDTFETYYGKLNAAQKKAADITDGPLLVLAGPGTGKTELLSARAANIIRQKKANPENILILTYTNAAAKAMKERLVRILGQAGYDVETATFHSFANSIILESEEAANYIQNKVQMEDIEQVRLLEYILDHTDGIDAIRPFRAPYFYRRDIQSKISALKKEGVTPQEFEEFTAAPVPPNAPARGSLRDPAGKEATAAKPQSFAKRLEPDGIYVEEKHVPRLKSLAVVYKLYEEYKNGRNEDIFDERGRYDYDDMIIFAFQALKEEKELKRILRAQYTHIMVDEFQDTNGAQMELLFELIDPKSANICCVGDDDQSIYRFQGASAGNFKIFKEKFPHGEVISLKNNYRSTGEIIRLSARIINHLPDNERAAVKELLPQKEYEDKAIEFHEFTTEDEELLFIIEKVKEAAGKGLPYDDIAVLVRKRDHILKAADAFLKAGIPYAADKDTDISGEIRVRQMIDVMNLAHVAKAKDISDKDALLYRVITSDYFRIPMSDILSFINYVRARRHKAKEKGEDCDITLFSEFLSYFHARGEDRPPSEKDAERFFASRKPKLGNPYAMLRASWAITRLISGAEIKPIHTMLMQYLKDAGVFRHILDAYEDKKTVRIRDLRGLTSFLNVVKESDLRNPAIRLADFIREIGTKKEHEMPLTGSLVTETQEGVRIFTAHGSKGLEFHTVIIPFCLQNKNWPIRSIADKIPLPPEIFKRKERAGDKAMMKKLSFYDEVRLFYVASTRAKSRIIYTASPTESNITSSYLSNIGLKRSETAPGKGEEAVLKQYLDITDKKDPFIGTEAALKDLIANLTLNPTSINNYIACKRKFLYNDVLKLPSEKRLGLVFGNCVHKALEDTYSSYMSTGKFPGFDFFSKSFKRELDYQGAEESIILSCMRQLPALKAWFTRESKAPVKPLGLEKKLAVTLGEKIVFTGKYDKTEIEDEKKKLVRVVDYKTGAPDRHIKNIESGARNLADDKCDNYLRQLAAYKLLFDRAKGRNRGFKVSRGTLVFVEPVKEDTLKKYGLKKGEFVNKTVEITEDMAAELECVIKKCWDSIMKLDFGKPPERDNDVEKCGGCDYDNICWV